MIYVAAAGKGSRIRPAMAERGCDLPKHLLPTGEPNGATLVRRNVERALAAGPAVTVLSNEENHALLEENLKDLGVPICPRGGSSSLGPFSFTHLMEPGQTGYSVAGDVFIEGLDWAGFIEAHKRSERPVTFLVGRTAIQPNAAVFKVAPQGDITQFYRAQTPEARGYRNIGVYAFSLTPPVVEILNDHDGMATTELYDQAAQALVEASLASAYLHHGTFFNINTVDDYDAMLRHTAG